MKYQKIPDIESSESSVTESSNHISHKINSSWKWLFGVCFSVILIWVLIRNVDQDKKSFDTLEFQDGERIMLRESYSERFVVSNSPSLQLGAKYPFLQGSQLIVENQPEALLPSSSSSSSSSCFMLRSSSNQYLLWNEVDMKLGFFSQGSLFSAISFLDEEGSHRRSLDSSFETRIGLKLCNKNMWIAVKNSNISSDVIPDGSELLFTMIAVEDRKDSFSSTTTTTATSNAFSLTLFDVVKTPTIRGVNFGGWFIPEVWMCRSFFNNTGLLWGNSVCTMTHMNRSLAEHRMNQHLRSWITEEDFQQVQQLGFDSIRLPIGFWNILSDPERNYVPENVEDSLLLLDWSFAMAEKYGLSILVDLHGLPGSQNGIDHSGCSQSPEWLSPRHQQLSLEAVEAVMKRYGRHSRFLGIELANEPGRFISQLNHSQIVKYYQSSYQIIRRYHPSCWIVFNELYDEFLDEWNTTFTEPDYWNVILDLHLYDWQMPYTFESAAQHIQDARQWKSKYMDKYGPYYPIIVGEWSMSSGTFVQAGQEFVDASVQSFQQTQGWYLWNWKIERGLGFDEWDVQYQMLHKGLNPLSSIK